MKELLPAAKMLLLFVVLTGVVFPVVVWAIAQVAFPYQANGSLERRADGSILGATIIGQQFSKPEYFHPRPSAAGNGYDAANSGGTNLGPTSQKLIQGVSDDPSTPADESFQGVSALAAAYRSENRLADSELIPSDAVTRSGSGIDPHISIRNAQIQAARVADARKISEETVLTLISANTEGRFIGIFGEPRVNVLKLNLALDAK